MAGCATNQQLTQALLAILSRIVKLTNEQIDAIREHDSERMAALDQQLEAAVNNKELALGEWRDHIRQHQCSAA